MNSTLSSYLMTFTQINTMISLHWYLAIIYQPHHVLRPPPVLPPPTPSVSTRGRKHKETEIVEQAIIASKANAAETMQESDPVSPDGRSREEVEEMFQSSCSISPAQSEHSSNTKLTHGDAIQELAGGDDSMIVDGVRITPELEYPADVESPYSANMDIDKLEEDGTPKEFSAASSESTSRAHSIKATSTASDGSAVAPTSFYASTVPQNKGKERAVSQPSPLDLSDSDKSEHEEVTDLLDESEPSDIIESSTYVFTLQMFIPTDFIHSTFIFTLDSLGSRHLAAVNSLKSYLKLEAKDKLGVSEASNARGLQAFVCSSEIFALSEII